MTSPAAASLTVDLDALAHNLGMLRGLAGGAEVAPVVKADAYGLGLEPVAKRLAAEGCRTFYVARLAEGEALREALPRTEVRVLDGCPPGAGDWLRAAGLTPVLNSSEQVAEWVAGGGGRAALMVDTGLNRLGLTLEQALKLAPTCSAPNGVEPAAILSHLACAEDAGHPLNALQRERFAAVATAFPHSPRSLANSPGVALGPAFAFDEVRPGIALYGGGPRGETDPRFRAVATLEAPILQVREVAGGESVGYGATFTAEQPVRVAVVAAGYADGVLRAAAGGLYGFLDGRRLPVLGRISMDLTALDVSDCPAARPGARVELLGPNVPVDEVARAGGTIAYEILTRLGARAERIYLGAA